jgi:protein-L-isoaspartate(D-aspartate) O-methyltransferase
MVRGLAGRVTEAMLAEPRRGFLPQQVRDLAEQDSPLPIGAGGTNSQPSTVRNMLELLDVRPGHHALDVGSGSGWTTAILSRLVGSTGRVVGVELEPELVRFGRENLGMRDNAGIQQALPDVFGWPEAAPYDRILVSAMADEVPQQLLDQLAPDGLMVIPVASTMLLVQRTPKAPKGYTASKHGGYRFVPLRER